MLSAVDPGFELERGKARDPLRLPQGLLVPRWHRGLAGRELTSSSPNRHILPSVTQEDESQAEIVTALGRMRRELVDNVRKITEPLFMLFDFKEFSEKVYSDIVRRFEAGEVT